MTNDLMTLTEAPIDWEDRSWMKRLTCVNHQGMEYLTKNPWDRSIHITQVDPSVLAGGRTDCSCPFSDLRIHWTDDRA